MVFFEAPHRTEAALAAMAEALGEDRPAAVCRELTKTHEEVRRGPLAELVAWAADGVRGEVTIVVEGSSGAPAVDTDPGSLRAAVADLEASGLDPQGGDRRGRQARRPAQARGVRRCPPLRPGRRPAAARPPRRRRAPAATASARPHPSRCRTRSSTTTATSTSPTATGSTPRTPSPPPRRSACRGSCRSAATSPAPAGRSPPPPSTTRSSPASRCTPTRRRGSRQAGRLDEALAEIERLAGAHDKVRAVGRDRARHLPHRRGGSGGAGGELPPPHRPRQAARQDAGHPRPRRPRRRAARSSTRRVRPSAG